MLNALEWYDLQRFARQQRANLANLPYEKGILNSGLENVVAGLEGEMLRRGKIQHETHFFCNNFPTENDK